MPDTSIVIGESFIFPSTILGEDRDIEVSLPECYEMYRKRHYPVLYLLDGPSHFHHTRACINAHQSDAV